ncbi:hypothetical protein [Ruminococcus albus]|nr:hypothetical protein [Ruminococcus albus]
MNLVEETVKDDEKYLFSTIPEAGYGTTYYNGYISANEIDWWLTLGDCQNCLISDVESFKKDNLTFYKANVKFVMLDVYKWSGDSSEGDLYKLNYYGLARVFKSYGCYETTITWEKGSRYPNVSGCGEIDLSQVEFEGISDPKMNNLTILLNSVVV